MAKVNDPIRARMYREQGIPTIGSGVGYAHSNGHAPNENIRIADYIDGIKHIAMVMHLFGGGR